MPNNSREELIDTQFDNPFYDNHVFNNKDMNRMKANWRDKLRFLFCPTLVQCSEGYAVFFKINKWGEYLIIKFEPYKIKVS